MGRPSSPKYRRLRNWIERAAECYGMPSAANLPNAMLVGPHEARFVPPDLIYAVFRGDVQADDARRLTELFHQWAQGIDSRFIFDLRELGSVGAGARDEFAVRRGAQPTDRDYRVDLAFIGASLRAKVLTTVVLTARSIGAHVKVRSQYFSSLEEAVAWAKIDPALLA
jgi:hypothetical protein